MSSFSVAYLHLGQNLYLNFRGLLGLKSNYRSRNKESSGSRSWEDWALTYCMTISHGKWLQFPQAIRVNPLKHQKKERYFWGRECCSRQMWGGHFYWDCASLCHSAKQTYQKIGAQFRDPFGSSHASPFKLIASHSFPNNALILTVGTWQCREFKSGCTLASHRMKFCIWF